MGDVVEIGDGPHLTFTKTHPGRTSGMGHSDRMISLASVVLSSTTAFIFMYLRFWCQQAIFFTGPALGIIAVEIASVTFCYGRATTAELTELASEALGEFIVVSVCLHACNPHVGEAILKDVADLALRHSAASVDITGGQDCDVAVSAVTAAIDHAVAGVSRDLEGACLIFVQSPKMILLVEVGIAAFCFIFP